MTQIVAFTVYFPPKIVLAEGLSPNQALDDAIKRYLLQGIAVLTTEEQLKEAQNVVAYGKKFDSITHETYYP